MDTIYPLVSQLFNYRLIDFNILGYLGLLRALRLLKVSFTNLFDTGWRVLKLVKSLDTKGDSESTLKRGGKFGAVKSMGPISGVSSHPLTWGRGDYKR